MAEETILREAEFTPKVQAYWLLGGVILCVITVVGIVVLPIWLLAGGYITTRYRKSLRAVLTDRSLKVNKGVLVRVEKTIPLEKITDMGMVQGPIMRAFDLHTLTVETAGGTTATGAALVNLTGVMDAQGFRDAVLKRRDLIAGADKPEPAVMHDEQSILLDIRDCLKRIETHLAARDHPD